jgi:HD-GYP domain-containing protein (c-di-GMP phosphodiesterase class II)
MADMRLLARVIPGIRHHHEHHDGSGYPDGLRGEGIPLAARIIAVADVFDALTSDRPYRKANTPAQALEEIRSCMNSHFDPAIASVFCQIIERLEGLAAG